MNELFDPQIWVRRAAAVALRDVVAILRELEGYRDTRAEIGAALRGVAKRLKLPAEETDLLLESVPYHGQREWIAWLAGEAETAARVVASLNFILHYRSRDDLGYAVNFSSNMQSFRQAFWPPKGYH
jgi:hypothetical protein